jgi:L-alanine-DL-glutamate epimerase-like enolase superfamily enzyme
VGRESYNHLIGLTIVDNEGVEGSGFSFVVENDGASAVKTMLDDVVIPQVLGTQTHKGSALWHELMATTHRIGRGVSSLAIGAADTALWDLNARKRGLSLADHIGRIRDDIPAYASGQFSPTLPLDQVLEIALREQQRGLGGIKLRVGMDVRADLERVAALRDALGPSMRIMCDANERLSLPEAIWLGRQLQKYDVYWFEEPLYARDVEAHAALAASIDIPIAVGEHLQSVSEFQSFIKAGAAHILQPDVGQLAGTTEFLRIAQLALENGVALAPHFLPELHIHLVAAFPNAIYLEQFPWADEWLVNTLEFSDGRTKVPDVIGHGIEFTPDARKQYLVQEDSYRV